MARTVKQPPIEIRRILWRLYKELRRCGLSIDASLSQLSNDEFPRWHGRLGNKIYKKAPGGHKTYFTQGEYAMFVYYWLKEQGLSGKKSFAFIETVMNVHESALKKTIRHAESIGSTQVPYDDGSRELLEINALDLLRKRGISIRGHLQTNTKNWQQALKDCSTPDITAKLIQAIS